MSLLLHRHGVVASASEVPDTFELTIASATVGSDLTDFPLYIDLSDMPSSFWASVDNSGGNIRAYQSDGTTLIPIDVIYCDTYAQTGSMFVKTDIATGSDTVVVIKLLASGTAKLAVGDTNGRNAVWADYEAVYTYGDSNEDRTGSTVSVEAAGDANNFTRSTLHTFTQDPHQGMTFDHENRKWYVFDTNAIYKFNEDFTTLEATNSDPCGDANTDSGETALSHLCDGCVANGYVVVPINDYAASVTTVGYIARYDLNTLALVDTFDITSVRKDISGICWDGSRYVSVYWSSMTVLDLWDTSFSNTGTITLTNVTPFIEAQGIEYWHGAYWVTSDSADEIYRVETTGYVQSTGLVGDTVQYYEGITGYDDSLVVLNDTSGGNSYARQYTRFTNSLYAGGGTEHQGSTSQYKEGAVSSLGTTWTMACSYEIDTATQMALMTYRDLSSGATNDRVTIAIDDDAGTMRVAVWDDANSWLYASPSIDPGTGTPHRIAAKYTGTTRRLYHDGALVNTENSITAQDADFDYLTIGTDDETRGDPLDGKIGFVYLTGAALSDDWMQAEYDNLSDPASFYSIATA